MTATEEIVTWALGLHPGEVPSDVAHAARRHVLDGIGCAVAAVRLGAARHAIEAAARLRTPHEATVIGAGDRLPAPAAALANGALIHALDFDDTHAGALVHVTAAVLPAALAVGEETVASGAEVLAAYVSGAEVVARLGAALPHAFHARGLHATSVCGVFAAALVAARLAGLGARETTNALGIAGSLASGSLEFLHTGSATKQLHPGLAGMAGITAARLAAAGADGPATILEGPYGLYRSLAARDVDPAALTEGLGARWETPRITIKPYPACQLSHASLDAIRAAGPVDPAAVEEVVFTVPPDTVPVVCEPAEPKRRPRTSYEGKFSLPYCAAALLVDGRLDVSSFDPPMLARPEVLALAARVSWTERDPGVPPAEAPGIAEVRLRDGTVLRGEVLRSRGGPEAPLDDEALLAKFHANCGGRSEASETLAQIVFGIEALGGLAPLLAATEAACALQEVP